MPDPEDSLGGEAFSGDEQQDPAEQSLGGGAIMGSNTAAKTIHKSIALKRTTPTK